MVQLNEVYMLDYLRTGFSRSRPGTPERAARDVFSEISGSLLLGHVLRNLFGERLKGKVEAKEVNELTVGTSLQVSENFLYGGRFAAFAGNMPATVSALGVDRQCGSAMSGMHVGVMAIMSGFADMTVAAGMEHLTRVPMGNNPHVGGPYEIMTPGNEWFRTDPDMDIVTGMSMIQTAQRLWEEESDTISKEDMDKLALKSHLMAVKGIDEGYFKDEILPVKGHKSGDVAVEEMIDYDQGVRRGSTLEGVAGLRPVSRPHAHKGAMSAEEYLAKFGTEKGMITAGNASPLNAGAAACVLISGDKLKEKGLKPLAKILSIGWGAVDPGVMGRGPVPASKMALKHAGLKAEDINYWEINEAFAIVPLNCMKEFNIPIENVNAYGGAIAIGHPLGASGIRLPGTLARTLKVRKAKYGLANLCCGGGQGVAVILENPEA